MRHIIQRWLILTIFMGGALHLITEKTFANDGPRVFLMDGPAIQRIRDVAAEDPRFAPAIEKLRRDADEVMEEGPFSVTFKTKTPPSGDKHDYMSIGPYWWPNPNTEDGLPYVNRDGETNPERDGPEYDRAQLARMTSTARTLALAWYFSGHEPYGERAALILRTWFLDPETGMNPNLNYAQAIPGRTEGRGIGIIDTVQWIYLVDAISLLDECEYWTEDDQRGIREWFADYLHWLKRSANGRNEQRQQNNHGSWYDAQVAAYALFTDQPRIAERQIRDYSMGRIASHFAEDGSQPHEISRTLSWHYSLYNLRAFYFIARLGEHVEIDLWNYQTENGRDLRSGLDYLLPVVFGEVEWPHKQIRDMHMGQLGRELFPLAIRAYDDQRYREAYEKLEPDIAEHFTRLIFTGFLLQEER